MEIVPTGTLSFKEKQILEISIKKQNPNITVLS